MGIGATRNTGLNLFSKPKIFIQGKSRDAVILLNQQRADGNDQVMCLNGLAGLTLLRIYTKVPQLRLDIFFNHSNGIGAKRYGLLLVFYQIDMGIYMKTTGDRTIKSISHIVVLTAAMFLFSLLPGKGMAAAPLYSDFYQAAYDNCAMTATEQGAGDCQHVLVGCLQEVFTCAQKSDCKVMQDAGLQSLECNPSAPHPYDCMNSLEPIIIQLITDGQCNKAFDPGALTLKQPGCGNKVVELNETCDDGNTLDGDECPSTCKDPAQLCGNGVLDPGEDCDAGTENGKVAAGCDIQCKSFPTEEKATEVDKVQQTTADVTTTPSAANCSLNKSAPTTSAPVFLLWGFGLLSSVYLIQRRI